MQYDTVERKQQGQEWEQLKQVIETAVLDLRLAASLCRLAHDKAAQAWKDEREELEKRLRDATPAAYCPYCRAPVLPAGGKS